MGLKTKYLSKPIGDEYKSRLQSYLAWMKIQNPSFHLYLTDEELTNYFIHEIEHPKHIQDFITSKGIETIANTHKYIGLFKDKTDLFIVSKANPIIPKQKGNYREA